MYRISKNVNAIHTFKPYSAKYNAEYVKYIYIWIDKILKVLCAD